MVLIILGSSKICGPILIYDHVTMHHQHQWPSTNIGNILGLWYQGYKSGVKGPWNDFLCVVLFIQLIQDMMHAGYNVEITFQVWKIMFLTLDNTTY